MIMMYHFTLVAPDSAESAGRVHFNWRGRCPNINFMLSSSLSRRKFLASAAPILGSPAFAQRKPQRIVVLMIDGFGPEYLEQCSMPTLARWREAGIYRRVQDAMP